MANQQPETVQGPTRELTANEKKFGVSIFKKWIYAKFDFKLILEIVEKDIYYNPKLSILGTAKEGTKKPFLSATLDLKALRNLQTELVSAIAIMEEKLPKKEAE